MQLVYTILSGHIKCADFIKEIPFALVFFEDGVYKIETFFSESYFFDDNRCKCYYTLIGKTEKSFDIEIRGMYCSHVSSVNNKTIFTSDGFVKLTDNRNMANADLSKIKNKKDKIFLIEIEGLKTHFADHSEYEGYKYGNSDKISFNHGFDHTSCGMILNIEGFQGNWFHLVFHKNFSNDNIILDFTQSKGYCELYYDDYLQFKNDLISFLSFINGNDVFIRKEFTGYFYSSGNNGYDAQIVYNYSRNTLYNNQQSDYIPIDKHHSYSSEIFNNLFVHCFDKFYHLNKLLDFNSLIFSLNSSIQTAGLNERYYILITALEKIGNEMLKSKLNGKQNLVDEKLFKKLVQPKLSNALAEIKGKINLENKNAFDILLSKIGALNGYRENTNDKLYKLFEYSGIPINDQVSNLIHVERNFAVHEGIIGNTTEEKFNNYWKLDHILRDIILNLIGYKSYRNRKFEYLNYVYCGFYCIISCNLLFQNKYLNLESLFT